MSSQTAVEPEAQVIRQRMQQIRGNLPQRVSEARADVKRLQELTDWKHYVRRYPVLVLPVVSLLAYQLVPRKKTKVEYVKESIVSKYLPGRRQQENETVAKQSFVAGVASAALGLALRSATSFAMARLSSSMGHWLHSKQASPRPATKEYSRN